MIRTPLRRRFVAAAALTLALGSVVAAAPPAAAAPTDPPAPTEKASPPPLTSSGRPTSFPWTRATIDLPWTAARLPDGGRCPGGRITFRPQEASDYGIARRGPFTYYVRVINTADVDRDGRPDQLVDFLCQKGQGDNGYHWYFVYSFKKYKPYRHTTRYRPVVLDYVTSSDWRANGKWSVRTIEARRGAVDVRQWVRRGPTAGVARTFRWTRHGLVPNRPLPRHPEADRAPR